MHNHSQLLEEKRVQPWSILHEGHLLLGHYTKCSDLLLAEALGARHRLPPRDGLRRGVHEAAAGARLVRVRVRARDLEGHLESTTTVSC